MRLAVKAALMALAVSCTTSPASAQFLQGPWNVHAQRHHHQGYTVAKHSRRAYSRRAYSRRVVSHGAPPANARCGWYMGRHTGHARRSLWLAQNWAREFPRTSARPGAVVVWSRGGNRGHVAKIVALNGSRCRATVHDNRGTYQRDICRGVIAYVRV